MLPILLVTIETQSQQILPQEPSSLVLPIVLLYPSHTTMARKIPSYKRVVILKPGEAPPSVPDEQLTAPLPNHPLPGDKTPTHASPPLQMIPFRQDSKSLTAGEIKARIQNVFNQHRYDPMHELAKLAMSSSTPLELRVAIHRECAQYIAPKLKSMDLVVGGELNLTVNVVKFSTASGQQIAPNREAIPVRATEVAG